MNSTKTGKRCRGVHIAIALVRFGQLSVAALAFAQDPVPLINQPLVSDATAPGGPDFTLTINGTGFASGSVVNWNGSPLATTFVSGSQLTGTVLAAEIVTPNTASVTVVNPAPGGGRSNVAFFTVTANTGSSVGFSQASAPATGQGTAGVAVGDVNADGELELAVVNGSSNTVSILLGDGKGNFTLASSPGTGGPPTALVRAGLVPPKTECDSENGNYRPEEVL